MLDVKLNMASVDLKEMETKTNFGFGLVDLWTDWMDHVILYPEAITKIRSY